LTDRYLRLDGETPANPAAAAASRGQIAVIDAQRAGTVKGIERYSYDGSALPVSDADLTQAEITTRDVDRGSYPPFLLKEICEAPASFRKTLRGRLLDVDGRLAVSLGPDTLSPELRERLRSGAIRRVVAIGQGTAAIAAEAAAKAIEDATTGLPLRVE